MKSKKFRLFTRCILSFLLVIVLVSLMSVPVLAASRIRVLSDANMTATRRLNVYSTRGPYSNCPVSIYVPTDHTDQIWHREYYSDRGGYVLYSTYGNGTWGDLAVNRSSVNARAVLWNISDGWSDSVMTYSYSEYKLKRNSSLIMHVEAEGSGSAVWIKDMQNSLPLRYASWQSESA